MTHRIFPHSDLRELAPNLWIVRGSQKMPLPRNMVVARLDDGRLVLHSPVAMNDAGMRALDALGEASFIIVPSGGHRLDVTWYKQRYPQAKVVSPAGCRDVVEEVIAVDGTPEELLAPLGIQSRPVPGMKPVCGEHAYEVTLPGGQRAILLNDVIGGGGDEKPGLLMRILGSPGGRLGTARIVRWRLVADKAAVRQFLVELSGTPDLKLVTISHGPVVEQDVAASIRGAAESLA